MNAAREALFESLDVPIGGVTQDRIMMVWPKVEGLLKRVVRPEEGYDLNDVRIALMTGKMQLWVIGDFLAVTVTSIVEMPQHRVLWVNYMAGDHMATWLEDWLTVQEAYAEHNKCRYIEFRGRGGWRKISQKHPSYKPAQTIFQKEI